MNIQTKYNIGDEVWWYNGAVSIKDKVFQIAITEEGLLYILYLSTDSFCESELFPTKEELLKSLER